MLGHAVLNCAGQAKRGNGEASYGGCMGGRSSLINATAMVTSGQARERGQAVPVDQSIRQVGMMTPDIQIPKAAPGLALPCLALPCLALH